MAERCYVDDARIYEADKADKEKDNTKRNAGTKECNMLEVEISEIHMQDKPDEDEDGGSFGR